MKPVPLQQQIDEINRELAMRTNVYPHLVASGKLTSLQAIRQNEGLMGALATLQWLQKHETEIKGRLAKQPA